MVRRTVVYVFVPAGHTFCRAWSQDAGVKQVERGARAAAHAF